MRFGALEAVQLVPLKPYHLSLGDAPVSKFAIYMYMGTCI